MEEEHNPAAYGGKGHNGGLQQGKGGQVGHFRTHPGAHGEAGQSLEEYPHIQMAACQVAQTAGGGNGEDNHHAGADGLEKGHAEDNHEGYLDVSRCADAEGACQKSGNYTGGNPVDIKFPSGEDGLPHVEMVVQPVCVVQFHIQNESTGKNHETGHET